ncbi:hypothetical protein [Ancylomarina longa]|uniref:Uncharacterized protein n=1 Tax=Ancylomarina longa TaxID=2487017 RepID=A0A434AXQ4_9BACT|nr:hypothetical protein [Ancylomarina longa]RUT79330.1 hypothetical protein DLK05_03665 [Ancylomarina longa]
MNRIFLLLLLISPLQLFATNENRVAGARSDAMGKASVAIVDIWSGFNNQASLARLTQKSFGAYYKNQFEIKELSTKAFCANIPGKFGTFSMNYTQFGFDLYKESKIGLAYSRALGKHFWVGLQFDQLRKDLQREYGSQTRYTFEIGLLAEIFPDFYLGMHLYNPGQVKFRTWDYDDKIPTIARFGFSWKLSNGSILTSEIEKDIDSELRIKAGIEYPISPRIFLRAGASNQPNSISMGFGFHFKHLITNIAFSRHPVLGYTPSADLSFQF